MARSYILNPVVIAISLIALGACGATAPVDKAAEDASVGNDAGAAQNDAGAMSDASGAHEDASASGDDAEITADDAGVLSSDDADPPVIEAGWADDASIGINSACANAGGFCTVTGGSPCAKVAPASAQDCNVHALPSGSFCCLSMSGADSGP